MIDYCKLINYCKQLCLELTRVNNEVFSKDDENNYEFSLIRQDNRVCEVKIYYSGYGEQCSIFTFSYDELCVYVNEKELGKEDFVFGGKSLELMQKIFDELINLGRTNNEITRIKN